MSSVRTIHLPPLESLEGKSRAGRKRKRAEASAVGQASLLAPDAGAAVARDPDPPPAPPACLGLADPAAAAADPLKLVWTFADVLGDLDQLRGLVRALATEGSQRYGTLVVACRTARRLHERLEQLRDADNQLARRDLEGANL